MNALIIDDNLSFVGELGQHLATRGFVSIEAGDSQDAIDYSTDSPYVIALKICQASQKLDALLIFINADISLGNNRRQQQSGVEVLKQLRLVDKFHLTDGSTLENSVRDAGCVIYSMRSIEQLLRQTPENLLLLSPGTAFARLPTDFSDLDLPALLRSKPSADVLAPYFRVDLVLPDDRHDWANWWGINQLASVQRLVEGDPNTHQQARAQNERQELRNRQAVYLFGTRDNKMAEAYGRFSGRIAALRDDLAQRSPRILHIDDRWHDGWSNIFMRMIYATDLSTSNGTNAPATPYTDFTLDGKPVFRILNAFGDRTLDQSKQEQWVKRICKVVADAVRFAPNLIFLDLRLFRETGVIHKVEELSGAKVLRWLRAHFKATPIIMTTASNKVWSLEGLLKLGADALWVKEGLDERRSAEESVRNYCQLLELVATATGEKYRFLNRFDLAHRKLLATNGHWWEQTHLWPNGDQTKASRVEVETILDDTVLMLRSYLQQYEMGYGYKHQLQERNWTAAILRHAANVFEEIHQLNIFGPGHSNTSGVIGGYTDNAGNLVPRRADWFAYELYALRNLASHHGGARTITWNVLKQFLANLMAYMYHGPQTAFWKIQKDQITRQIRNEYDYSLGRLQMLRQRNPDYQSLYRTLIG